MDVSATRVARECPTGGVDLTTLGTRILRAASVAAAIHLHEQATPRPDRLIDGEADVRQTPPSLSPLEAS